MLRVRAAIALAIAGLGVRASMAQVLLSQDQFNSSFVALPSASGDLFSPSDVVSDGVISAGSTTGFPSPLTVAIYPQEPIPAPSYTDTAPYHVFRAWSIGTFPDTLTPPVRMSSRFFPGQFNGPEGNLRLFKYDLLEATWTSLSTTVDGAGDIASAMITEPGLYGLGSSGSPVPAMGQVVMLFLITLLGLTALILMRRSAAGVIAGGLLLAAVWTLPARGAPEVTTPGSRPITHIHKDGDVTEVQAMDPVARQRVPALKTKHEIWEPKPDTQAGLDYAQAANWKKSARDWSIKKSLTEPLSIGNAKTVPNNATWDNDYLFYNCTTYALRGTAYLIVNPDVDGKVILDKEYTDKGAADGANYQQGDVVTYVKDGKITHFAKVNSVDQQGKIVDLVSKWGFGYIYQHKPGDIPDAYGAASRVYRK